MKTLRGTLFILPILSLLWAGCRKDKEAPIISDFKVDGVIASSGTHAPGASLSISFVASDDEELKEWELKEYTGGSSVGTTAYTAALSGTSTTVSYSYAIGSTAQDGSTIKLEVILRDDAKTPQEDVESYTITVKKPTTPLATEKTGQFYHIQGTLKGAFDLVADVEKGAADSDADKDMKNTDSAGSVFTGSWTTGNSTMQVKNNSYDYTNATVESASAAYSAGTPSASVSSPATGDIYVAKLRGGSSYAVIKITAVDPNDNTCACLNKGKISFSYKK